MLIIKMGPVMIGWVFSRDGGPRQSYPVAMVGAQTAKWQALSATEQAALASATFEDDRRWFINADFNDVGAALAARGLAKLQGDRWSLTATGHIVQALRARPTTKPSPSVMVASREK